MRRTNRHFWQFSKFASVGVVNTAIDALLFIVLARLVGLPVLVASSLSFLVGSLNSFLMNKYWTFEKRSAGSATARQYGKFLMVSVTVLSLHQICLLVLHLWLGAPAIIAKGLGILLGVTLSFGLSKRWVFGDGVFLNNFTNTKIIQRVMAQWRLS